MNRNSGSAVAFASMFILATGANAQEATPAAAGAQDGVLDEIIVTAQKRSERLQTTPIAITAVTGVALEARGLTNLSEIAQTAPNVLSSPTAAGSSSAAYNIRGIGQTDFITTTEPGVGVYLDGIYLARITGSAVELADIERVEVLRGPQGTLFGRNTTGGAVSIVTKRPSFSEAEGTATLSSGVYTEIDSPIARAKVSYNQPLSDVLAARVSVLGKMSDGWGHNDAPGRDGMGRDRDVAGRLVLRYQPTPTLDMDLTAEGSRRRGTNNPHHQILGPFAQPDNPKRQSLNSSVADDVDAWALGLSVDYDLGWSNVRSISSYRKQDGTLGLDLDGTTTTYFDQETPFEQDQFSQELQLSGALFDDNVKWLVGGYYFEEHGMFLTRSTIAFTPIDVDTFNDTSSLAAFGEVTFQLAEGLRATAGARYTNEEKKIDAQTVLGGVTIFPRTKTSERFDAPTYKLGLDYQVTPTTLTYASFTQGFRSGGFNGRPILPTDLTPFGPEKLDSYEIGIKTDLFDRLRLNLSGFYSDYSDIQVTAIAPGAIVITTNAANARIRGVELETEFAPTDSLTIRGVAGFLDNDDLRAKSGFTATFGGTLPQSSRWNTLLGVDYRLPDSKLGLRFNADWSYRSKHYFTIDNADTSAEDGYHLVNARVSIQPDVSSWRAAFYVKNLTNSIYRTYGQTPSGFGFTTVFWAPTRSVGIELSRDF